MNFRASAVKGFLKVSNSNMSDLGLYNVKIIKFVKRGE